MTTARSGFDRRAVINGLATTAVALGFPAGVSGTAVPLARVRPGDAGWPVADEWAALGREVGDRLAAVTLPDLAPAEATTLLKNPYYIRDQAGLTQSSGYLDGWRSTPSAYVVRARDAADVAAAIRFAARHRLRLVVKGGGHSYLGGSNASNSLLIWTRDLEDIALHDTFVPAGTGAAPVPAVSVGAGCIWHDVYDRVTTKGGRYVQGGGCVTVGVAGLVQGGGFGSFSKAFGLAAANLLEAEIVTADGRVRTVNAANDSDLFWALKGGGGGTWGVITRLTLATHDLPMTAGVVRWRVHATSDAAFRDLVTAFVALYAARLMTPHWGEQVRLMTRRRFEVNMLFQGIEEATAAAAWADLNALVAARPADFVVDEPLTFAALPMRHLWNGDFVAAHMPGAVVRDPRAGANPAHWWWAGNTAEVAAFWHGYESLWLPAALLDPTAQGRLVDAWIASAQHWSAAFHFNKGLAGGAATARAASTATAMNPQVLDAFALVIVAMDGDPAYPGFTAVDIADARDDRRRIAAAMADLRHIVPDGGSYLSECNFALADWQRACWGEHALRLEAIKAHYDPGGLFLVHHGIGSARSA